MKMTIKSAALSLMLSAILGSAPAKGAQSGFETLARDNTAFALSLYGKLAPTEGNLISLAKKHYGVLITPLDYRTAREPARETINRWVEKKTENKITDILQPTDVSDLTRLVLVNAIYFKGKWASQFKPGNTKSAPFHVSPDKTVQAPMMTQKLECRYASLPQMDILELQR